jgi:cytochrome c553
MGERGHSFAEYAKKVPGANRPCRASRVFGTVSRDSRKKSPMNRTLKIVLSVLGAVVGLVLLGVGYLFIAFPKVAAAGALKVQSTPEMVARGAYLAEHVTACLDCHSLRDWKRYSAPPIPGSVGGGGEAFTRAMGFPGNIYSKNVTPTGLASWTDGEIARAIAAGVSRDGRALFPIMPYPYYRHLCDADLNAIVAYLRTLPAVTRANQQGKLEFPMNLIVRTIPSPPEPWNCPSPGTPEYGKYLTTIAVCAECHTQQDHGKHKPGMEFAGGWSFPLPGGGHVTSANITPDPDTGIGNFTREEFIAKFKAFDSPNAVTPVSEGGMNTIMPWTVYAGMTTDDLGAIYDHLRKQQPVRNVVERFHP